MDKQINVNGKIIYIKPTISSFKKTMGRIRDEIIKNLSKIGITSEFIDLDLPRNPFKRDEPAQIGWRANGQDYYYSCSSQERYVDNLGVVGNVIHQEVYAIRNGLKSFGQVMNQFRIGYNGKNIDTIKSPREILGIGHAIKDKDYITFIYKRKAKEFHPDNKENGDENKFKDIHKAYKDLMEELK